MSAITLNDIKAAIVLQPGEHYAGIVLDQKPEHSYHLILLPGSANDVTHEAATEWAASIGGDLPTRSEQALLFANLKDQFEKAAYWAAPRHESAPDFAWYQHFDHGRQLGYHRHLPLRARAVRRLIIQ
ncbi:hypothetical protein [Thauera butanivorans]|uniref:hypothetical protein n=1 Tax=Thauera butanivorans TaxID=86174 RepID=UPI0008383391|nr:hypothetical protein [Thauera butanivorans]